MQHRKNPQVPTPEETKQEDMRFNNFGKGLALVLGSIGILYAIFGENLEKKIPMEAPVIATNRPLQPYLINTNLYFRACPEFYERSLFDEN